MNLLEDSPLEALAFNYLSFGFTILNNLWTWLAVITATISFWKIRTAGCPKPDLLPPSDNRASDRPDPAPEALEHDAVSEPVRVPRVVGKGVADVDGVTKGKFTVYYEDDRCECDEALTVTEEWMWKVREGRSDGHDLEWWESWERLLGMKGGESEHGWYTCQDLTALNGNVVRFWDGGCRFGTFERDSKENLSCVHVW